MQRLLSIIVALIIIGGSVSAWSQSANAANAGSQEPSTANNIEGEWQGVLSILGTNLRLVLRITRAGNGPLKARLDSLDQPGAMDLNVDSITLKGGGLHFEMTDILATYDGTLSRDGFEIVGVWNQTGNRFSLVLRKGGLALATAPVKRGRLELKPCNNPALTKEALCGKYDVFEDRNAKAGRRIALNMILLPSLSTKPAADATFYLVGGPGGAATDSATKGFMTRLRRERDVVLVDQRGTGESNPLNCEFQSKADMQSYFGEPFAPEKVRACREKLEKVANLKLYTSELAMDDLDEIRAAFGYDKINVYGGSYGSTTSLVYLRQHPEHVRTVTVSGVAPPDAKIPLSFAKGVQHAMDRLLADCAADKACNAAFPKLQEEFVAVLKKFDNGPVDLTAKNVFTGEGQKISLTRDGFVEQLRLMLYVPNAMSALPFFIHLAAQGDFGPLANTGAQIAVQIIGQVSQGMQLSIICGEDAPFITEEEIKRASAGSFYGDSRVRRVLAACKEWPQAQVPKSFLDPIKGNVPVLLISGEVDPVTPPWLAEAAARHLPNSRQLIVRNGTHTSYDCTENLVADFIDKGSAAGLDTSCVDQIKRPPFHIPKSP